MGAVATEVLAHSHLLNELLPLYWLTNSEVHQSDDNKPITVITVNTAARQVAENSVFHKRMKHTHISHHFIRKLVAWLIIRFQYGKSKINVADMMVKTNTKVSLRQKRTACFGSHIAPDVIFTNEEKLRHNS